MTTVFTFFTDRDGPESRRVSGLSEVRIETGGASP